MLMAWPTGPLAVVLYQDLNYSISKCVNFLPCILHIHINSIIYNTRFTTTQEDYVIE